MQTMNQKRNKYFKRFVDTNGELQESKQNRSFLINEYDNSVVESNVQSFFDTHENIKPSGSSKEGFMSSVGENIKNLWRTINYDMDNQAVDEANENLRQVGEEKKDLDLIDEYVKLIDKRDSIKNKLETSKYTNVKEQEDDIKSFQEASRRINDLNNYFMGEGRTHKVIADTMFDGTKTKGSDLNSIFAERIKRGWSNKPNYGWQNLWGPLGFVGGGVEYGLRLLTGVAGVAGEVVSGTYGDIKDLFTNDHNSTEINDYVRNLSSNNDDLLKRLYRGENIKNQKNIEASIARQKEETDRDYNARITDLKNAQDDLKNGRLFGIDGAYDYDQVSEEWKNGRTAYQDGSFWGAFVHPFYATADIASSLDMMKYQLYAKGADIVLRNLPKAIIKKAPWVGTAATIADVAAGVTAAAVSRDEETKLEAIGAIGNRVAREAMANGADLNAVLGKIREDGARMGIDTDAMSTDQLWQLGVALDIQTGDDAFENAKKDAQKGINRLINANNALSVADYAEMLPYMSYFGDVTKSITKFGGDLGDKVFTNALAKAYGTRFTRDAYKYADKRIVEEALSGIRGPFDRMVEKAASNFVKKDMPKAALYSKHAAEYLGKKGAMLASTGIQESLEEGVQTLLTNKYGRGEYDKYNKTESMFDVGEFVQNPLLAMEAVQDYFGAVFGNPGMDGEEVRKAMNMGFWSSIIQSGGMHALTNFTGPTEDNFRGFVRQMRDDKVAVRILADEQKKLQDFSHVDMFYDRFRRGADWNSMYTALNDLKDMLSEKRLKDETQEQYDERMKQAHSSLAKQEFIEDDIKLMSAVWSLYNSKEISEFLEKKGINKKDEQYRQFLRDGATALMDYHKTAELIGNEVDEVSSLQDAHIELVEKLLGDFVSPEEKQQLIKDNGKFAQTIDDLRKMYAQYVSDYPKHQKSSYESWRNDIKTVDDFIKAVGKDAITSAGIDDDIANNNNVTEETKISIQANRLFNNIGGNQEKRREDLLKASYEKQAKDKFSKDLKNDKSLNKEERDKRRKFFTKNTLIRNLAKDKVRFDEDITPYLERIFDNDEETANQLIDQAYEDSKNPISEKDWITTRIKMLHQLKKRQGIERVLTWAKNQEESLRKIKKLTGLDVDPSKIKGWIDFLEEKHKELLSEEQSHFTDDRDYSDYFKDYDLQFDKEELFNNLTEALYINRAILKAQGHVANAYRSLQEAPSVLRDAVFGRSSSDDILSGIADQYRSILDRMNSRSEAETRTGVDELVDLEDMKKLSRDAAWKLIESKLKDAERRRKIVHRRQEEEQQERINRVVEEAAPAEEGATITRSTKDIAESDAEKALREGFYHEPKKKTDAEEEIRKRKKALSEEKDSADEDVEEGKPVVEDIEGGEPEEEKGSAADIEPSEVQNTSDESEDEEIESGIPEEATNGEDTLDIEQTSPSEEGVGVEEDEEDGPVNTDNIEDAVGTGSETPNDDDDITLIDEELPEAEDIEDSMDPTMLETDIETNDILYDGSALSDDLQDSVRDEMDIFDQAERGPVDIDDSKSFDDSETTEGIVGEPGPNLIWQTLFYGYNQTTPPVIKIGGNTITEFNGKPLRSGSELSKKLSTSGWLNGTKQYYIVTQSQEAANVKDDKDAFTVMMVIEDEDSSYATFYKTVSTKKISISPSLTGKDGLPMKFHINDREDLINTLLMHNMDVSKILNAISTLNPSLYKKIAAVRKDFSDQDIANHPSKKIYRKLMVDAYKEVINAYAKELYAQSYQSLHVANPRAKEKGYREWNLITANTVIKSEGETDKDFADRKLRYKKDRDQFEFLARRAYSKPDRIIFAQSKIEEEVDKLKQTRDEIIDAYLTKDENGYVFPNSPQIGKVEPQIVSQSNGTINSIKTSGGMPVLRNVVEESLSLSEVQDKLEDEELLVGIGRGFRASKTVDGKRTRPIVKWGFSRSENEIVYEDGGCSGKIYMIVPGIDGKPVPVMLSEEKFNVQHRVKANGETEPSIINNSRQVELCIDPQSKTVLGGKTVKPSAAEVLLYMILGEINIPGFTEQQKGGKTKGNISDLVALFINAEAKTLLGKQPAPGDKFMQTLASKQLYYGTDVQKTVKQTESGKSVITSEETEGLMHFHIGMKVVKEIEVPDGRGGVVKQKQEVYEDQVYSKEEILGTSDKSTELRQRIVQAIATQMHWNTDDFTFGESAAMDASKTVLGRLVEALRDQAFAEGKFKGLSLQQILDYRVSIMDCPQLSFRIGDFYEAPEGATSLGQLKFARGSVLAWMFKAGHLKTDLGDTPFRDPFVFGHGVKRTAPKNGPEGAGENLNAPLQPAEIQVDDNENPFYNQEKEQATVNKLGAVPGLKKSGISIPKTAKEREEKLKKWTEFLKSQAAKNKKFADRISIEDNDILDMILLSERTDEDICKLSETSDGIGISEEDEEGLEEWNEKLRDAQIESFVEVYNKTHSDKISKDNITRGVLKKYGNLKAREIESIIVYKEKATGKVKVLIDTLSAEVTSDKKPIKPEDRHYFSKAATGVFSHTKTKGEFEEKKARAWLADKLGIDQDNVIVWDAVKNAHIDKETYGEVNTIVNSLTGELIGKIGLSRQGGASVHYHEAWHYVNLLMLSRDQREKLYQAYLDSHPFYKRKKPSNKDVEERMADDFRKWVVLYEDSSISGKIKRFFMDLLDFLRLFVFVPRKAEYRNQFKKIVNGDYRQSKVSQENLRYFKQEWKNGAKSVGYHIPSLSEQDRVYNEETETGFQYISNHQQYFDASQAIARRVIQDANIKTAKDIKKISGKDYQEILNDLTKWINESEDLTEDDKHLLTDVMSNEHLVKKAIQEAFEELGLTAKIRTLKDYRKKDSKEPEEGIEPDPTQDPDGENKPDNTWDRFDLSISKKDNAAVRAKLFMKQIPILKRVIKKDGTVDYEEVKDRFGNIETYSFSEAWNLIVENLWQCESLDEKDANGYKPTSLMGMIEAKISSNSFYESLYRQLNSISGAKWRDIELRSQIYSTINSNKPQVAYLRIDDPLKRTDNDDLEDGSFDETELVRNGVVADIERNWTIKNDNEEEVARNLPRDWSRALTAHGLIEVNKDGKTVISKNYADRIKTQLKDVKKELKKINDKNADQKIDAILDKVIDFYNEMAIPLDKDSLTVMMQMSIKGKITNQKIVDTLKDWFINEEKTSDGQVLQNTLPKMAEAIIKAAESGKTTVTYGGDKREKQLDELYSNFGESHHMYKLAQAINTVHPSSREFSIKGPNGERIYPVSQNSFVSDRVRKMSTSGKEFSKSMTDISPYCANSLLLDIAGSYTKPLDQETHFKLNAFVGIKDVNRKKGADYFGITPMEDYIAKMIMTEKDQIILPTMADKKTWYSISHKNLKLVHDAILVMPYKDILNERIYEEYSKEHERPAEGELGENTWKTAAERWYRNLSPDSEVKQQINDLATKDYTEQNKDIKIQRYGDNTLKIFAKYMMGELNALIDYYSEKNINLYVNERPQMLTENYYGNIFETEDGQKRLDFSGNGGKFRYFYDVLTFTDSNGTTYNLNQRLQYLWELQRKIEAGQVKDIKEDDPLYPYVGQLAISSKDGKLDGFELIRQELNRIKEEHFQQDTFISDEILTNMNSILIAMTKRELDRLSEPNSPYKMVKKVDGMYLPEGIPTQLIRKYAKEISKKLGDKELHLATTKGADEYLMQDALFSLIASYVANSAISVIEFEKAFSGDPAFYKRSTLEKVQRFKNKSALPKKGKSGIIYVTSNNEKAYIFNEDKYKEIKDLSGYGVEKISIAMEMNDGSVVNQEVIVDDVYDTFSDKIKRLGSTLSPGDELRLHYTPEELEKYKELQITDYTNMNVEDINAQSIFIDQIKDTFKKQLLIDHIRAIDPEKFKTYCDKNRLDFEKTIAKLYRDQDLFDKVYKMYSEIHSKIEKELKQQTDPYQNITVSDAQVFVRPELYRKIRIGLGQWSYDDERAYRIIESDDNGDWLADEKKYEAVRKLEIFPLKMSYFQNDPQVLYKDGDQAKGRVVPMLNKMAVFPLFKFQATSDTGRKLYNRMNKSGNELDMISFKSAVKVGPSKNGVKMSKDGASVEDQLCSIDDLFNNDSNQAIDYRKTVYRKKIGEDGKPVIGEDGKEVFEKIPNQNYGKQIYRHNDKVVPVQIQKLENLRMQLNTSAHKVDYRNIGTQMFKLAFSNIIDDAEYGGKTGAEIKKDIIRIINDLTDVGVANIKEEFYTNGRPDQEKIKRYIKTIIENNGLGASAEEIIESGVAASIASRNVFENSVTKVVESEVVDIETSGGSAIQQSVFGFSQKKNVKAQSGAYKINYNNGEELSWNLENGSMEVLLSMNFFRQVMPEDIKKKAFTEQKQWLIDHDFIKGTKTDGTQANPQPFGVGYRIPTQGLSSMFAFTVADVMPESVGDLIIVPREFTAQTGSDFDVDKLYLATFSYKDGVKRIEETEGKTKKVLTNQLLDYYVTLITDEKNYANARASIDVLTNKLKKDFVRGVIRSGQQGYLPSLYELTPSFQVDRKREFSIGKEGIAPFALNVTNLSLTQLCHLTMRYEGSVADYEFGALDQIYGKDGRRIADWLSAMVNAHVDVAKDPYIFDLNINHATYNYANFLLRAGMGMSTFTFLAQQSLKNIADEVNNAGGIYGGNIDGSKPESEIYKKRKAQAIENEFRDIYFRLKDLKNDYENLKTKNISKEKLQKLDRMIEYAYYMSLSNYQKRKQYADKDREVPDLGFDRKKVFDENVGIKAIENGKKSDIESLLDYYEFQLAAVRCFKEISGHAQGISSLVSSSQIDTKKFGNTIKEHINYRNKIDHMYEDHDVFWTINEEGYDQQFLKEKGGVDKDAAQKEAMRRYYQDSYLEHKFDAAVDLIKEILQEQLFSATDQYEDIFKEIFGQINGKRKKSGIYEKELSANKIDAIGDALDNVMRFNALFNTGRKVLETLPEGTYDFTLGGNKQAVIEKFGEILFGSENRDPLYKRLDDLKRNLRDPEKKDEYWDIMDDEGNIHNDLLDILTPQSPNSKSSVGKITLSQSLMDKDSQSKRKLIASFAQLLASEVDEVKEIAEDLMFYAYYSQYDQNTANSFFDLVPTPYRKQYDDALSVCLHNLSSSDQEVRNDAESDVYDDTTIDKIIDIICRNHWYDDEIVPRYFVKNNNATTFQGHTVVGRNDRYGEEFGFPRFISFVQDNSVKGNKYLKVKIGKDTLLYRQIGEVKRIAKKDGKPVAGLRVFVPIPKAGLHQNGTHQFEFYADYKTPSVFKDNRIGSNFSHDVIRDEIDKLVEKSNKVADGQYVCSIVWDDETIPEIYSKLNRQTYDPLKNATFDETIERLRLHAPEEYADSKFKDPEELGIRTANVVIDINDKEESSIKYKDKDNKYGVDEKYKDKVVVVNSTKKLSQKIYDEIKKQLLSDPNDEVRRIYVNIGSKTQIPVTQTDIDNYLKLIGVDSQQAVRLLENTNSMQHAVRQNKINVLLNEIMSKLKKDGVTGIYLDCSYYGNPSAAEAVQYCKLYDNDISAHIHISKYARYDKPKHYDNLKWRLHCRREDFVKQTPATLSDTVAEAAVNQEKADEKAKAVIEKVKQEVDDDVEFEAMNLGISRKNKNIDEEQKPDVPPIIKQVGETPTETSKNKGCAAEVNDIFDD